MKCSVTLEDLGKNRTICRIRCRLASSRSKPSPRTAQRGFRKGSRGNPSKSGSRSAVPHHNRHPRCPHRQTLHLQWKPHIQCGTTDPGHPPHHLASTQEEPPPPWTKCSVTLEDPGKSRTICRIRCRLASSRNKLSPRTAQRGFRKGSRGKSSKSGSRSAVPHHNRHPRCPHRQTLRLQWKPHIRCGTTGH